MASEDGVPPMGDIPAVEENSLEAETGGERAETPYVQETPAQIAQKSPPRNGIPPKRLLAASKRTATSYPSTATRPTTSSISRKDPANGLSKPPTRPISTSGVRRPTTNVTATSAPRVGHRPRSSISSVEGSRKGDVSGSEETSKSSANSAAKRMALSSTPTTRSPARPALPSAASSATRGSTLMSSTNADSKPASSKVGTGNPAKPALRTTTNTSRPASNPSTARSTRSTVPSTKDAGGSDVTRKKLNAIPVSPAPMQSGVSVPDSKSISGETAGKKVRPGLLTRKSTMSVTIEQRLREMELVHKMLTAAMTDDGLEDDVVKEEYGKTADNTLASLKAKLAEAKLREGKDSANELEAHVDGNSDMAKLQSVVDHERPQSNSSDNAQKVSKLELELASLKDKMLEYTEAANKVSKDVEDATERMAREQASKIDELRAIHSRELGDLRAALDEAERQRKAQAAAHLKDVEDARRTAEAEDSKMAAESLDARTQEQMRNAKFLEDSLAEEREKQVEAISGLQRMEIDITSLKGLLNEEQQKSRHLAQEIQKQQENAIKELDEALNVKDTEIANLENEIQNLQSTRGHEIEEQESATSVKESKLETEIQSLRSEIRELKTLANSSSISYNDAVQTKDQEILHQNRVIEDLQNKVQQLHEVKERELDEVKYSLIQEHEQTMSNARREHESVLSSLRDSARERDEETTESHQREKSRLQEENQLSLTKLETSLKAELANSIGTVKSAAAKEIEGYRDTLEETQSALAEIKLAQVHSKKELSSKIAKIDSLESERDHARKESFSAQQALEAMSTELANMRKALKALENASHGENKQHAKALQAMKDEMDATSRSLEENTREHNSVSETHHQELEKVGVRHSKEIKRLEKKHRDELRSLQKTHDELLAKHNEAEKKHLDTANALEAGHADTLQKERKAHERLEIAHDEEMTKLRSRIQEFNDVLEQRHNEVTSCRKALEDSRALQQMHEAASADLEAQLEKQGEVMARLEQNLRKVQIGEEDFGKAREAAQTIEELRRLLVEAKSKAAQDKEAIDKLTAAVEEASGVSLIVAEAEGLREKMSELTEQHAAEISKLHETTSLGNEKREEERQHEAEVRDRVMEELEKLKSEMTSDKERFDKQQQELHIYEKKTTEVGQQLTAAHISEERLHSDLQKTLAELEKFQAEARNMESSAADAIEAAYTATNEKVQASQALVDKEREKNASLDERLREAELATEKYAVRVREVESALKVTTAELVEMRTERPRGSEYAGSVAPKPVLRSSLWPISDSSDLRANETAMMAGMQEQIRQLEDVNEDMMQDSERLVKLMARVTESKYDVKSEPELSAEEIEEEEL